MISLFSIDCPTITARLQGVCYRYGLSVDRRSRGPAGGQWDDQDGQAAAGVSRTAVWGRAALCMAGASCDWWGGNIEKLIRQLCILCLQIMCMNYIEYYINLLINL